MPKWSDQLKKREAEPGLEGLEFYFAHHQEWLLERILDCAVRYGYARYILPGRDVWQEAIAGLTAAMGQALAAGRKLPELTPDEVWQADPCFAFGSAQAQWHRRRGIPLEVVLGLLKHYRQIFDDLLHERPCPGLDADLCEGFVQRFFDRIEIGFCSEWAGAQAAAPRSPAVRAAEETKRRLELLLAASEERFRQFVENIPLALLEIDCRGRIELVNPALERLYGRPRDQLLGQAIFEFVPESERTRVQAELAAMNRQRPEPRPSSQQLVRPSGRLCDVEVCWDCCLDPEGNLTGFRALLTDVSERDRVARELEAFTSQLEANHAELTIKSQALEQAHHELKQAQSQMLQREKMASVGQLAAGVAHEINNPLGFISSNLTNLGRYVEKLTGFIAEQDALLATHPDANACQSLAEHRRSAKIDYLLADIPDLIAESLEGAKRVKEIVQNLKSFSRIDESDYRPADINQCLDSTIRIVWNELKYKATLERDYGELPLLPCQPQQLNQVFMNLLVNAAQAIESQGVIRISTRQDRDAVLVTIADNGCGMSEEVRTRIFEPFYTTKPVGQGTGLGMSIVYDIIKRHHGEICVDSAPGQGTSFVLRLPLQTVGEGGEC